MVGKTSTSKRIRACMLSWILHLPSDDPLIHWQLQRSTAQYGRIDTTRRLGYHRRWVCSK